MQIMLSESLLAENVLNTVEHLIVIPDIALPEGSQQAVTLPVVTQPIAALFDVTLPEKALQAVTLPLVILTVDTV